METIFDTLVIGAGLAGLACASKLAQSGRQVAVLERSAWVGGRCASKVVGQSSAVLDFGPMFVHGDDPQFQAWIEALPLTQVPNWPQKVRGQGLPCQPAAFQPGQFRYAFVEGLRPVVETLAKDLTIFKQTEVTSLRWNQDFIQATARDGRIFSGRDLVVALATEQSAALLSHSTEPSLYSSPLALLNQFSSVPSLTLLALYPATVQVPDWDIWYPEASRALLLVSNESAKRHFGSAPALVFQARQGWSATRFQGDKATWSQEILEAGSQLLGPWALNPVATMPHRWQYGRLNLGDHLAGPAVFSRAEASSRLALTGELFDPSGGLQGAWRSGRRLADRLKLLDDTLPYTTLDSPR